MKEKWHSSQRFLGWFLTVCATVGLIASFTLLKDTFELAKNPDFVPSCNINPFLSCTGAMASPQAEAFFGIPNPAFGIAAFTALLVFAVLLIAGTKFKAWIWLAGLGAAVLGLLGSVTLYFVSLFDLGTICPWCFATWITVIATGWALLTHVLSTRVVKIPKALEGFAKFWVKYAGLMLAIIYTILIFGILLRFNEALFV